MPDELSALSAVPVGAGRYLPVLPQSWAGLMATPAGRQWYDAFTDWMNQPAIIAMSNQERAAAARAAGFIPPPIPTKPPKPEPPHG